MYLEFIYLFIDYFKTINKKIVLFEWLVPLIISVIIFYLMYTGTNLGVSKVFKDNSINLLGVLAGFSITIITIITTSDNKNLDNIKTIKTDVKIGGKNKTLFDLLLLNFSYSVILETFLLIICLIYPLVLSNFEVNALIKCVSFSILVFLIIHVLLLTIRNLTSFYLIITKQ